MAVSTTASADYNVDKIVGLAMVTAGVLNPAHYVSGEIPPAELQVGREWLFLKLQTIQSAGTVLRARERVTLPLVTGQAYVDAAADTLSIEDGIAIRHSDGVTDRPVTLINVIQYQSRADKTVAGSPIECLPEKQASGIWRLFLWPVPDGEYVSIIVPRTRRLKDVEQGSATLDVDAKMHLFLVTHLAARFAGSKGRRDTAMGLASESSGEQQKAESDETNRGGMQLVAGPSGAWD